MLFTRPIPHACDNVLSEFHNNRIEDNGMTTVTTYKYPLKNERERPQKDSTNVGIHPTVSNLGIFPHNLMHDPKHTLDGMLVLRCFFCEKFQTPLKYDKVHLRHTHQKDLVTKLPLRGRGYNMDYRTDFAIDIMKLFGCMITELQVLLNWITNAIPP
jgi:hypothetical protein